MADLLPLLGLSAVAGFLAAWKVPFMIVGLILSRILSYRKRHMPMEE